VTCPGMPRSCDVRMASHAVGANSREGVVMRAV
jgi:hypothetical protein